MAININAEAKAALTDLNGLVLKNGASKENQAKDADAKARIRNIIVATEQTPTPTPEPEPTPEPSAKPIFEATSLPESWFQEKAAGRIAQATPGASFKTTHSVAWNTECRTGDSSSGEAAASPPTTRAEVMLDWNDRPDITPQEKTMFYRYGIYIPPGYNVTAQGFRTMGQWRNRDESPPIVAGFYAYIHNGQLCLCWDDINGPVGAVLTPGSLTEVLLEAVWSTNSAKALQRGFVNGNEVGVKHQTTKGCYAKFGNYKQASIPTCTVQYIGWVCGESRAAVGL